MSYVIPAPGQPVLPVEGTESLFPVHRIYCVGRNYADHAREMGHNPDEEPPFFFLKPADVILQPGQNFPYPAMSNDVQHEAELVVAVKSGGSDIREEDALAAVFGYAVGIDMTRRDLQNEAKGMGRPWDSGKAFDHSAPCSALNPVSLCGHPERGAISLSVDGQVRQSSDINHMIWKVPQIIARLSELFTLAAGDLIFTGTPAGVGPVLPGQQIIVRIEGVAELQLNCD